MPASSRSSSLDSRDLRRYSRQIVMPEWGIDAQRRLETASALVIGVGGLGSPAVLYLAAAGIGQLQLVDFDVVDESNLQRQILFDTVDVGEPKLEVAARRVKALNPNVDVSVVAAPFDAGNGRRLVAGADVVLDGSDNFPTRYLVNDACVLERTPNVFGSIRGFEGQVAVFAAPGGPCYRCLHPEPPPDGLIPSCGEAGVLGVLPGVVGAMQATEAIKVITGIGEPLVGRMLMYDARRMRARDIHLPRDPACAACGDAPTLRHLEAYAELPCAAPSRATAGSTPDVISVADLRAWRAQGRAHMLVDVREPGEQALGSIPGAMLVPLADLDQRLELFPRDRPVVVHCRSGMRSSRATARLRRAGIDARSLSGGLDAWAVSDAHSS